MDHLSDRIPVDERRPQRLVPLRQVVEAAAQELHVERPTPTRHIDDVVEVTGVRHSVADPDTVLGAFVFE
jgi:hypothetical protein